MTDIVVGGVAKKKFQIFIFGELLWVSDKQVNISESAFLHYLA